MFISHKVFSIVLAACIALCVVFQRNNIGNIESSTSSPPVVNSRRFLKSTLWDLHSDLDKSYVERKVRENYDLEKAKIYAQELLDLMYNRYELYNEEVSVFFFTAWNFGNDAFNVYKYRFARKIMEGNARYLMTFGGSSVTAGHDGKLNSSFPMIAEKRLRPIMEALGIDFEVDNIAQATNNCIPYGLCYESMGKINPDFVGWEQVLNVHMLCICIELDMCSL